MNLVAAVCDDWGIGYKGTQPVVLSSDRRHFRNLTLGSIVITGRKSMCEFPGGKPLTGRMNIVLTHDKTLEIEGAIVAHDIAGVFSHIEGADPEHVFVIGGGSIYELLMPYCHKAYITQIKTKAPADTFLANLDADTNWTLIEQGQIQKSPDGIEYAFNIYENKSPLRCPPDKSKKG